MLYEWRIYEVMPERMRALHNLFENTTLRLFEKHGFRVIGFWEAVVGTTNVLYYMLAWESMAHMEKAWNAFRSDPEWVSARKEAMQNGPLTKRAVNMILRPTPYSPMK